MSKVQYLCIYKILITESRFSDFSKKNDISKEGKKSPVESRCEAPIEVLEELRHFNKIVYISGPIL